MQRIAARALAGLALACGSVSMTACQQDHGAASAKAEPTPVISSAPATSAPPTPAPDGRAGDCQKTSGVIATTTASMKTALLLPITAAKASDVESAAANARAGVATIEAPDVKAALLRYATDMEQVAVHLRKAQGSPSADQKELGLAVNADQDAANDALKVTFVCANQKGTTTTGRTTTGGTATTTP
ncbi:MAG: hypothetical protein QOJ50_3679 [Cryptosporangiaceae bacterium]|nr:hypothetical protein [Cryptosporangiaceae bacterium]